MNLSYVQQQGVLFCTEQKQGFCHSILRGGQDGIDIVQYISADIKIDLTLLNSINGDHILEYVLSNANVPLSEK